MRSLSTEAKLALLGEQAQYDVSVPGRGPLSAHDVGSIPAQLQGCVYPAAAGGGRCLPVLKVLVTNLCTNDCHYCATRCSADVRRTTFRPEELAGAFIEMERRGLVRGLFLSSGIAGSPDAAQALIVDTATIVRRRHGYRGYMHLKVVPGASAAAIQATVELADRVSVNMEAPNEERLSRLAPQKIFHRDLLSTLRLTARYARAAGVRSGVTSQYVAGGVGESDAELLIGAWRLYQEVGLKRMYYSGFRPVSGSPLGNVPEMPATREHRLYQADWLLRFYGFRFDELVFDDQGLLPISADPKWVWAARHPEAFPVDVATADREELLRVPGIGPTSAQRILQVRREGGLRNLRDLARIGVRTRKARHFIVVRGCMPGGQMQLPIALEP